MQKKLLSSTYVDLVKKDKVRFPLSKFVQGIHSSPTFLIDQEVKKLQTNKVKVYNLNLGEPDFPTPVKIKSAGVQAIISNQTKYTNVSGLPTLLSAISRKLKQDNRLNYTADEIIVTNGAKQAIYEAIRTICEIGDEIIILAPYWVSYPEIVKLAGGKPVIVRSRGFRLSAKDIEKVISKKTKAIIINSPNNPLGMVYSKEELLSLSKLVLKYKFLVITDEIYERFLYGDSRHVSFASLSPKLKDYTLTVNGVSKTYAMTGWRIGYCAGPKYIIEKMIALQSNLTSCASAVSQAAAVAAVSGSYKSTLKMTKEFDRRRKLVCKYLENFGINYVPTEGAYYIFFKVAPRFKSLPFCKKLLKSYNVALNPGESFGVPGWVRLSYTVPIGDIEESLKRIGELWQTKK